MATISSTVYPLYYVVVVYKTIRKSTILVTTKHVVDRTFLDYYR